MVLPFTNQPFRMCWPWDIESLLFVPLLFVPVELLFQWSMFYVALKEAYLLYDIMRSETSPLLCLLRFAPKCVLNLQSIITLMISPLPLPTLRREHAWILQKMGFGLPVGMVLMGAWVFNLLAPSNSSSSLSSTFKKHENIKRRAYGKRICEVEHTSFTPTINPWLPPSGVMSILWFLVSFVVISVSYCCACSSFGVFSRAPPPMDLMGVEPQLS